MVGRARRACKLKIPRPAVINQSQWALYWIWRKEFVDIKKVQLRILRQALPVASWHLNKVGPCLGKVSLTC